MVVTPCFPLQLSPYGVRAQVGVMALFYCNMLLSSNITKFIELSQLKDDFGFHTGSKENLIK